MIGIDQRTETEERMGAWGAGTFDNDDALDWLDDLLDGADDAIRDALESTGADPLEAPDASSALAAAEVVAAALGRPAADLPGEVSDWLEEHGTKQAAALAPLARQAVDRVRQNSELKDLWEETDPAEWTAAVDDLLARLSS
jgi:hypothetical protein